MDKAVAARARSIAHQDNRCDALETIQRKLINGVENLYQRKLINGVHECVSDERERDEREGGRASRGIVSVSREVEAGAARARSYARTLVKTFNALKKDCVRCVVIKNCEVADGAESENPELLI